MQMSVLIIAAVILCCLAIIIYISMANKAKKQALAKQEENLLREREMQEKQMLVRNKQIEEFADTDFFRAVSSQIAEVNKKYVLDLLESGQDIKQFYRSSIKVGRSSVAVLHWKNREQIKVSVYFNALGFKILTDEERGDLDDAVRTKLGYKYFYPDKDFWQPIIDEVIASKNEKYKSIQ